MDHGLVSALLARGVQVLTTLEAGMIERLDRDHLAFATEQGRVLRVLYSYNVEDYCRIHASDQSHAVEF